MSFSEDEEILQDFLVEAGEILEQLSEQLVALEKSPDDKALLNAVFRGFHTVKGGAGFLQLGPLVDLCHITENLFDLLRNGKKVLTPELMDVVLQALDAVNEMFAQVQNMVEPDPADAGLMARLHAAAVEDGAQPDKTLSSHVEPTPVEHAPEQNDALVASTVNGDITDEEFEQFLNAIDAPAVAHTPAKETEVSSSVGIDLFGDDEVVSGAGDEITEDEFEALLDQLHGKGRHSGTPASDTGVAPPAKPASDLSIEDFDRVVGNMSHETASSPEAVGEAGDSDLISDDEFEALLDQLHGKGKGPSALGEGQESQEKPAPTVSKASSDSTSIAVPPKAEVSAAPTPVATTKPAAVAARVAHDDEDDDHRVSAKAKTEVATAETTVRVDTQRLDDIMNMVGELVLVRNRLVRLGAKTGDEEIAKAVSNLDVVTADLQTAVMKTRMQPIKKVFGRFPRVVRDLARNLKKEVVLELQGEETDLDKNLVEALADPLVHLVRNAVDHGIEMPAERDKSGKARAGKITLSAEQEGDHILLSITDDGAGMDPDRLRRKAVEKGLMDEDAAARLTDNEAFNLIFLPGFSTKSEISDISGRGVGMDVVKTKITQLNGTIQINSRLGEGSRIAIKVPLTLAIMPTLMVMLGHQTFALPLVSVNEIFHMDLTRTNVVDGREVVIVRDKALPVFYLKRWLVGGESYCDKPDNGHVVIVSVGTQRVAFIVDQLIGQEEVVIKPLGKLLQGTPGMAGATITGDGRIALILDVPSMLKRYA